MRSLRASRPSQSLIRVLGLVALLSGCGSSEQLIIQDPRTGIVFLTPFSMRGTTGRYPGAMQPIRATHPIALSPELVARILSGFRIGIIPAEAARDQPPIKPRALLSESEIAAIAPGISAALKQANSDQYVRFLVGADPETTEAGLYIDGPVLRFTLNRYRSPTGRRDQSLSIYALSFTPESTRISDGKGRPWLDTEAGHPSLAIAYAKLAVSESTQDRNASPSGDQPPARGATDTGGQEMKAIVERQAEELKSVKEELESLKKELRDRTPAAHPAP